MSIYHLGNAKELKKIGAKLGRENIAKRALLCAESMMKDLQYMGVIEFLGRMKALAQACNFDGYWSEKVMSGYHKEMEDLGRNDLEHYYGYCGKNIGSTLEKEGV